MPQPFPPAKALQHPSSEAVSIRYPHLASTQGAQPLPDREAAAPFSSSCMQNVGPPHTMSSNSMALAGLSCPGTPHAGMGGLRGAEAVRARTLSSPGTLLAGLCPGWWLREIRRDCNTRGTAGMSPTTTGVATEAQRAKAATKKKLCFYHMLVDALTCQTIGRAG